MCDQSQLIKGIIVIVLGLLVSVAVALLAFVAVPQYVDDVLHKVISVPFNLSFPLQSTVMSIQNDCDHL